MEANPLQGSAGTQVALVAVMRSRPQGHEVDVLATHAHLDVTDKHANTVKNLIQQQGALEPRKRCVVEGDKLLVFYSTDERQRIYVAVTLADYPLRVGFRMLEELQSRFMDKVGEKSLTANPHALTRTCYVLFKEICVKYSDVTQVDQISKIQAQVDFVKLTMEDNIRSLLQNDEKLENIASSTEVLNQQAKIFQGNAKKARRVMKWRMIKTRLVIAAAIIVVLTIIVVPTVLWARRKK